MQAVVGRGLIAENGNPFFTSSIPITMAMPKGPRFCPYRKRRCLCIIPDSPADESLIYLYFGAIAAKFLAPVMVPCWAFLIRCSVNHAVF